LLATDLGTAGDLRQGVANPHRHAIRAITMARARRLTHLDRRGRAHMVDVSAKPVTQREAVARGEVGMRPATVARISEGSLPKGDVLVLARVAGIMAAKRTAELIPLCHTLPLSQVDVELTPDPKGARVLIESRVRVEARTGVEMEALTAVAVAGLTLYDMCKAVDREMTIGAIRLVEKRGGRSGTFVRRDER
jgi:cyclic pyranopterin phosphate synthase